MLERMLIALVDIVSSFFVYLLLARFHFQWLRVSFHNQIGEFVVALTNWAVKPARRVVPAVAGLDVATLLVAWLLQLATVWIVAWIGGFEPRPLAVILVSLIDLFRLSLHILVAAVLLQAILSWINPYSPIAPVLDALTRPFLRPIRRFIPPVSNFDLTPAVLLLLLMIVVIPLVELLRTRAALLG